VTGAGRGLGRAIALALANAGADIALGFRDIKQHGGPPGGGRGPRAGAPCPLQMDVGSLAEINSAVDKAAAHFGKIDILVNNVGVAPENLAENVTEKDFDLTLALNLKGTFFTSQAVGRLMMARRYGRIINMSSQAGFIALPGEAIYCNDQGRDRAPHQMPGGRVGKYNINVTAVARPSSRRPEPTSSLPTRRIVLTVVERIAALHRIGSPMEVAGAVVFLASPAASLITGDTLIIDGGWTAR
jgi:NAD(P)-dependent dehydrogenase (short-subunit alcohol dehydrogenase family)